jgi:hypothetical protein
MQLTSTQVNLGLNFQHDLQQVSLHMFVTVIIINVVTFIVADVLKITGERT